MSRSIKVIGLAVVAVLGGGYFALRSDAPSSTPATSPAPALDAAAAPLQRQMEDMVDAPITRDEKSAIAESIGHLQRTQQRLAELREKVATIPNTQDAVAKLEEKRLRIEQQIVALRQRYGE